MRKLTTEEFVKRAQAKYGDKFDYSETEYTGNNIPVKILCREHGVFYQRPNNHLNKKYGCTFCSPTGGALITQEQFLAKCINRHGNKFDYSDVVFTGVKNNITIICPMHGRFVQIAEIHYKCGCSACSGNKRSDTEQFRKRAIKIHKGKYDYSEVNYKSSTGYVKIICPEHGPWMQTPQNHLTGRGCKYCSEGNSSKKEQGWLDTIIPNDRFHRNVKIVALGKKYNVDGYIPGSNVVYEFLGDYWHGHPIRYRLSKVNTSTKKTFWILFNNTIDKIRTLRKAGYKVICMWEWKYDKLFKEK